jgi:hypothetical protein
MMTHLTCPQCSTPIPARNINVQDKIAVCPACDTVFKFNSPDAEPVDVAKLKRRKVKQPANLTLRDDEQLEMIFRTNFRLTQNEDFILGGLAALFFGFLTSFMILPGEKIISTGLFVLPLVLTLVAVYRLALLTFNRTHITADDHAIRVARRPLPNPLAHDQDVPLAGIAHIRCVETDASKREKYDTPRYRVFAETVDGREKLIVNDMVEDYGYFIAAQLQEHIDQQNDTATIPLADDSDEQDGSLTTSEQRLTDSSAWLSTSSR